jgi:hypothetical protein
MEKNEIRGHVARMAEGKGVLGFWLGNLRERDHWGDPGVDGSIILIFGSRVWWYGLD